MGTTFPKRTQQQVRQAVEVMTAWIEGDDDGHPLALDVIADQVRDGGPQALADLAIGLALLNHTLLALLEDSGRGSDRCVLQALALGFLSDLPKA